MRFYQMDAAMLAQELNTDIKNGRTICEQKKKIRNTQTFLKDAISADELRFSSKANYAGVLALICFGISVVFACLNKNWSMLLLSLIAILLTFLFSIGQNIILSISRGGFLNRLHSNVNTVKTIRDGREQIVRADDLTVGDLLVLSQGDLLFCDARVIECENLFVDERVVFGRKISTEKNGNPIETDNLSAEMQTNMLWKGSALTSGRCLCLVVAIDEDCYVEKTGGRKEKKQHSAFLNRQRSIGQLSSVVIVLLGAILFLIGGVISGHLLNAILCYGTLCAFVFVSPFFTFDEWTYYFTAKKLRNRGALVRNLEAFDGMASEKVIYFNDAQLLQKKLSFSHIVRIAADEKTALSYFALCCKDSSLVKSAQKAFERHGVLPEQLEQMTPGIKRGGDLWRYNCSFVSESGAKVVSVCYWKKALPCMEPLDPALITHVNELENQGKYVSFLLSKNLPGMPGDLFSLDDDRQYQLLSMLVFNVQIDDDTAEVVRELQKSNCRTYLYCEFSETFGKSLAAAYDLDDAVFDLPNQSCYTLPQLPGQTLVADLSSLPNEQENANLVLSDELSPQQSVFLTKCMLCGLKRARNFWIALILFVLAGLFVTLLNDMPVVQTVIPVLLLAAGLPLAGHLLVESTKNCTRYLKSLLLGSFCGLACLVCTLMQVAFCMYIPLVAALLLSLYLWIRFVRNKQYSKESLVTILSGLVISLVLVVVIGGNVLSVLLPALFAPLAAWILDLFY